MWRKLSVWKIIFCRRTNLFNAPYEHIFLCRINRNLAIFFRLCPPMFLILCLKVRLNGKWNLCKQFVDSGLVGQGITIRIKSFLVQTPLGSWLGLETQSCWKTSSDFQVKIVKTQWLTLGRWGFSLDNGPKLAIGQQCSCKKNTWRG